MTEQKSRSANEAFESADRIRMVGPGLIFGFLIVIGLMRGGMSVIPALSLGVLGAIIVSAIILRVAAAAGAGFLSFLWPSGTSTPYEKQYSQQEAMAIRGDVAGAIASYEEIIANDPTDIEARVRLAELHARSANNPERAAECFREARRVDGITPERDLYISNRLIDLLRGPLKDEGRALVELRRLVQLHPASRDADFAREAISRIKVESIKDSRDAV